MFIRNNYLNESTNNARPMPYHLYKNRIIKQYYKDI